MQFERRASEGITRRSRQSSARDQGQYRHHPPHEVHQPGRSKPLASTKLLFKKKRAGNRSLLLFESQSQRRNAYILIANVFFLISEAIWSSVSVRCTIILSPAGVTEACDMSCAMSGLSCFD